MQQIDEAMPGCQPGFAAAGSASARTEQQRGSQRERNLSRHTRSIASGNRPDPAEGRKPAGAALGLAGASVMAAQAAFSSYPHAYSADPCGRLGPTTLFPGVTWAPPRVPRRAMHNAHTRKFGQSQLMIPIPRLQQVPCRSPGSP